MAKIAFSNASPKDKAIKKQQFEISKNASKLSDEKLVAQNANLVKFTNEKTKIVKNIADTKEIKNLARKNMSGINVIAKAAKVAKEKADADARAAKEKAKADASKTNAGLKATRAIEQASKKSASDYKKAAKKVVSNVLNRKHGQKATPFKVKNRFALLSDNDDDMDYENNGIDFLEPSNLTSVTQGTTNLMTKQKDLFSFMNSMTPLIENAKKMLSGLDLSKLQA